MRKFPEATCPHKGIFIYRNRGTAGLRKETSLDTNFPFQLEISEVTPYIDIHSITDQGHILYANVA